MKLEKLRIGDLAQTLRSVVTSSKSDAFVCVAAADVLEGMEKAQDVLQSNLDNNLAELARLNEQLENLSSDSDIQAWKEITAALDKVCPGWLSLSNRGISCAVQAIEQLAAKAERLEQHCTYRSKTWGEVCRALDKVCPDWSNTLNPEDATAAAVKAIEKLARLSSTIEGFDLSSQTDFIGRAVVVNLGDISVASGGGRHMPEPQPVQIKKLGPVISAFPYKHECFKDYPYLLLGHFWDSLQAVLKAKFPNTNEQRVVLLEDAKALVKREFEARLNKAFGNAKDLQAFEKLCNKFEWV